MRIVGRFLRRSSFPKCCSKIAELNAGVLLVQQEKSLIHLAMIIAEIRGGLQDIQVSATDIDDGALEKARTGIVFGSFYS